MNSQSSGALFPVFASSPRGERLHPIIGFASCYRCGLTFDCDPFTYGAPCVDCQDVITDGGDTTMFLRRVELRFNTRGVRYVATVVRSMPSPDHVARADLLTRRFHAAGYPVVLIALAAEMSDKWVRRRLAAWGLTPNVCDPRHEAVDAEYAREAVSA